MTYPDLETQWRKGCTHALRRLPAHIRLTDPDATLIAVRSMAWLVTRTVAAVALLVVVYAAVKANFSLSICSKVMLDGTSTSSADPFNVIVIL